MAFKLHKSICRFFRQHRKKLMFAGVLVGGMYGVIKFAEYKIKDYISQEQQKISDKMKIEKSFEQVQQHSLRIATAVMKEVMESVKQAANSEAITEKLKSGHGDKISLWQELKVMVFTRVITGASSAVLVFLIVRVQLNQIAGLLFHSSTNDESKINTSQQKFLSILNEYLIKYGIKELVDAVKDVVNDQLQSMPLQSTYNAKDVETTLHSISSVLFQKSSDSQKHKIKLSQFALADSKSIDDWTLVNPSEQDLVEKWLAKTADVLESPDFESVSFECIKKGLSFIGNKLDSVMLQTFALPSSSSIVQSDDLKVPLAKLLPILNAQISAICSESFLKEIADSSDLTNTFLTNVFDSFIIC